MTLTDEMKRVIIKAKTMNGTMMIYSFLGVYCMINGATAYVATQRLMQMIFGAILLVFVCLPRIKFAMDVQHDKVIVTKMTVVDKLHRRTGHRRTFLYLRREDTGDIKRHHVLGRIYNEVEIGDEGIYVANRSTCTYYFQKEFQISC